MEELNWTRNWIYARSDESRADEGKERRQGLDTALDNIKYSFLLCFYSFYLLDASSEFPRN